MTEDFELIVECLRDFHKKVYKNKYVILCDWGRESLVFIGMHPDRPNNVTEIMKDGRIYRGGRKHRQQIPNEIIRKMIYG